MKTEEEIRSVLDALVLSTPDARDLQTIGYESALRWVLGEMG